MVLLALSLIDTWAEHELISSLESLKWSKIILS